MVDDMIQVEMWRILSYKCAIVAKDCPIQIQCEGEEINRDVPRSIEKVSIRRAKWCRCRGE